MNELERWLPLMLNLVVAAFIYGGLTVRVQKAEESIDEVKGSVKEHDKVIGIHGRKLAHIEGQKAAAAHSGGD